MCFVTLSYVLSLCYDNRDGIFEESITNKYTKEFVSMLHLLLHTDPTQRPTASAVVSHCIARRSCNVNNFAGFSSGTAKPTTTAVADLCNSPMSPSVHNTSFWVSDCSQTSSQSESQGDGFFTGNVFSTHNNNINSSVKCGSDGITMTEVTPQGKHTSVYHDTRFCATSAAGLVSPTTPSMMDTRAISSRHSVGFGDCGGRGRVSVDSYNSDNCGVIFPLSATSSLCNSAVKATYHCGDDKQEELSRVMSMNYGDLLVEMEKLKRENEVLRKRCLLV